MRQKKKKKFLEKASACPWLLRGSLLTGFMAISLTQSLESKKQAYMGCSRKSKVML